VDLKSVDARFRRNTERIESRPQPLLQEALEIRLRLPKIDDMAIVAHEPHRMADEAGGILGARACLPHMIENRIVFLRIDSAKINHEADRHLDIPFAFWWTGTLYHYSRS
jgi:hypothetical protein